VSLYPPLPAGERVGEWGVSWYSPLPAGERLGEWGVSLNNLAFQRVEDRLHYVVGALEHVVVPKTHYAKALSFKPRGSSGVQSIRPIVAM